MVFKQACPTWKITRLQDPPLSPPRLPSPPKLEVNRHSPEGDKITAARESGGGVECIPSRKTDREIKLRCIGAGKEGRKCKASATCRNRIIRRRRRATASTQPTLLFPRRSLRGEGRRPEFLPRCLSRLPISPIEIVLCRRESFHSSRYSHGSVRRGVTCLPSRRNEIDLQEWKITKCG